ncbi:MAG: TIGR03435 family protein [Terriglobia bacterium]
MAILAGAILSPAIFGATDVSGKWSGFPIYVTLKQDGNKVTGSAGESEDDQIPFQNGVIEDDHLTLKFGPMDISFVVNGDQMTGELHQGMNTLKIVLKRMRPRDPSAPPLAFDAASVKRAPPQEMGKGFNSSMNAEPGRLRCTNVTLKNYIEYAWALKDYEVTGPDWLKDERYDITATMPAGSPPNEVLSMFQTLLNERFKLDTHKETKELSVYALVVDKNGFKLKAADGPGRTSISGGPKGRTMKANASMKRLAATLSGMVDRPVLDMTGIPGGFNILLEWTPDETQGGPRGIDGAAADTAPGPSIYMALHEVGLKLEARKAPVEILVVDHAGKIPGEN